MKDQLAIYPSRSALSGEFLFSALFTVIAGIMFILFQEDLTLFVAIILGAMLLLFAFLTVTTGRTLARNHSNPQPQLLLDTSPEPARHTLHPYTNTELPPKGVAANPQGVSRQIPTAWISLN